MLDRCTCLDRNLMLVRCPHQNCHVRLYWHPPRHLHMRLDSRPRCTASPKARWSRTHARMHPIHLTDRDSVCKSVSASSIIDICHACQNVALSHYTPLRVRGILYRTHWIISQFQTPSAIRYQSASPLRQSFSIEIRHVCDDVGDGIHSSSELPGCGSSLDRRTNDGAHA